jgi:hypothetical protein
MSAYTFLSAALRRDDAVRCSNRNHMSRKRRADVVVSLSLASSVWQVPCTSPERIGLPRHFATGLGKLSRGLATRYVATNPGKPTSFPARHNVR